MIELADKNSGNAYKRIKPNNASLRVCGKIIINWLKNINVSQNVIQFGTNEEQTFTLNKAVVKKIAELAAKKCHPIEHLRGINFRSYKPNYKVIIVGMFLG